MSQTKASVMSLLARDAGLSLLGAAVLYPAGVLATAHALANREDVTAAQAGVAAVSVMMLIAVGASWLTGPTSLIGRLVVYLVTVGSVGVVHVMASQMLGGDGGVAVRLTVMAAALALLLVAIGWLVRCAGGGRSLQYGAATLVGLALLSTAGQLRLGLKHLDDPAQRRALTRGAVAIHPLLAAMETAGYRSWLHNRVIVDYETGEAFGENLGADNSRPRGRAFPQGKPTAPGPDGDPAPALEPPSNQTLVPPSDLDPRDRRPMPPSGVAWPADLTGRPIWLQNSLFLGTAGGLVYGVALLVGWVRLRTVMA